MQRSGTWRDAADACDCEHVPAVLLPSDPNMYWQLTEEEKTLVSQLTETYRVTVLCGRHVELTSAGSLCSEQVSQTIARVITFFMAMPDFAALHPEDQAAALRVSALPLFLLTNAFTAFTARATVGIGPGTIPPMGNSTGQEKVQVMAAGQDELSLIQLLGEFQCSLRPILRDDLASLVLMQCTLIFDASVPGIGDRQHVSSRHDKYQILLKHYVESQCSYLFSWHYLEPMFTLMKRCKALAVSLVQQLDTWCAIVDSLIQSLCGKTV